MAQPQLDYQIKHAGGIHVCTTAVDEGGVSYAVAETLKGAAPHGPLHPDTKSFQLLGYEPSDGESVVLFFSPKNQLIELMPLCNGKITYAPGDASMRKDLTPDDLRRWTKGA